MKMIHSCVFILLPSPRRSASGEGIVVLGVCVSLCLSAKPRLHTAMPSRDCRRVELVAAAKVMRCIQCSLGYYLIVQRVQHKMKRQTDIYIYIQGVPEKTAQSVMHRNFTIVTCRVTQFSLKC